MTCNYFEVLELKIAPGPGFSPSDCETDGRAVILGHHVWTNYFGSDPNVVGKEVMLNRQTFRIAGVAPQGFTGLAMFKADYFAPLEAQKALVPDRDFYTDDHLSWLSLIGRRAAGAPLETARADLEVIAGQIDAQEPGRKTELLIARAAMMSLPEARTGILMVGGVILAAFGLVLLIACANVANLLLARAAARGKEIAVRLSVGSSRARLVQQLLTESVLVSAAGGVLGSLLALWSFRVILVAVLASLPDEAPPLVVNPAVDWRVLLFAVGLTLVTGVIFGLVPALTASKPDLYTALKSDSAGSGRRTSGWLRSGLVGVQVAVCLVLMVAAGLLMRGLYAAQTADPGFTYKNVTSVAFDLRGAAYDEARATAFHHRLRERLRSLPGVEAVEQVEITPLTPGRQEFEVRLPGGPEEYRIGANFASPGYFELIGIPIVRGRAFLESDMSNTSRSIIVTESTARRYWPGQDPIGKTFLFDVGQEIALEVVGVARDAHLYDFAGIEDSYMYLPASPRRQAELQLLVRSRTDFAQLSGAIRQAAQEIDPALVAVINPLEDNLEFWRTLSRLVTGMASSLGALALLLASIGVYGVVSYAVSRRLREVGIRMVLGANTREVLGLILKQALRPVVIGLVIGLAAAAGISRILESVLFGVSTHDALAFAGAPLFLLGIATLASWLPARRAARVDPMTTLRYE